MSSIMRRRRGLKSAISILLSEGLGSNTHILSARRRSTPPCPSRRGSGFVQSLLSTKPSIRPSIGTENPIPEEMDHREIAVRVPVMNEVQFLFASEPCKPLKLRSLYVVFLVEKDVRVERRRTCNYLNHEEINGQYEVCTSSHQKHRNEEEGCIVAFVTAVRP